MSKLNTFIEELMYIKFELEIIDPTPEYIVLPSPKGGILTMQYTRTEENYKKMHQYYKRYRTEMKASK